ncbi:hypothetical protein NQZ79_g1749 [Umbelopsis isabellina]|nr:hypothetical protein NQZ79_g1749 [Umbelopsis isabellina]
MTSKFALTNVRVFDGNKICDPSTVVIDGDKIGTDTEGATTIDCEGAVLLPGLIDAHIHLSDYKNLQDLSSHGVTTGLDMATADLQLLNSLRGQKGVADVRSAYLAASAPGSVHSRFLTKESLLTTTDEAVKFVDDMVNAGADYIKVVADIPGPSQEIVNTIVEEAHKHGKICIAHAATFAPFQMAQEAKADIVTHAPIDKALDTNQVELMVTENRISVPTLTMMETMTNTYKRGNYDCARQSVTDMYKAGVPILAGTDANSQAGSPAHVPHGDSMHHELELLVGTGMSNLDALKAATSLPAKYFGLPDRGVIAPGKRADLLLIGGDPLQDIKATRLIKRVWCAGVECDHV